ncbi:hypothetical protein [Streptomyces chryseus]
MSGAGTVVEIGYSEGWDLAARALPGPLTVEAARARDAAGLPYAAVTGCVDVVLDHLPDLTVH